MEECKRNAISKCFFLENLRSGRSIILEITDIKWRPLSKHLFQRTQQHGDCTRPLGNAKFV